MYYSKEGPGPATLNIRDGKDPLASFIPKKISSTRTGLPQDKRQVGQPLPNHENPGPNVYMQDASATETKL